MARRSRKPTPEPAAALVPATFDYESALARGELNEDETGAILDLLLETTNAGEIALRLNLPPKLVRKTLDDPALVKSLVIRNFNAVTVWYITVALGKLKTAIDATTDPELLVKLLKLMGDNLAIGERFAKVRSPAGRPKTTVNVGVQVTPYDKLVRTAADSDTPLLEADLVGDDDDGADTPG